MWNVWRWVPWSFPCNPCGKRRGTQGRAARMQWFKFDFDMLSHTSCLEETRVVIDDLPTLCHYYSTLVRLSAWWHLPADCLRVAWKNFFVQARLSLIRGRAALSVVYNETLGFLFKDLGKHRMLDDPSMTSETCTCLRRKVPSAEHLWWWHLHENWPDKSQPRKFGTAVTRGNTSWNFSH